MAFSDSSMYPGGIEYHSLTSTVAKELSAANSTNPAEPKKINWILVSSTAACSFEFRAGDDSPIYAIVNVPANTAFILPGWKVDGVEGLEVVATGAGTLHCTVAWLKP